MCVEGEINTAQKRIATYKEEFTNAKEIRQHRQGIEGDFNTLNSNDGVMFIKSMIYWQR